MTVYRDRSVYRLEKRSGGTTTTKALIRFLHEARRQKDIQKRLPLTAEQARLWLDRRGTYRTSGQLHAVPGAAQFARRLGTRRAIDAG